MIGTLNQKDPRITIIGGGIAGMLLAERLSRENWKVDLFETSDRLGGLISTHPTPEGLVESAAHSLLASAPVRAHFKRLGVPLDRVDPQSRSRFVRWKGKLRKFPLGPLAVFFALIRAYFVRAPRQAAGLEWNLEEWSKTHVGEVVLTRLIAPMVTGIYGCSPRELSVAAAFPRICVPPGHSLVSFFVAKYITRRSRYAHLRRPKDPERGMAAPRGGMQTWVNALEAKLRERKNVRIHLQSRRDEILETFKNEPNLALCVPALTAAQILAALHKVSSQALSRVPASPLAAMTVFPRREDFRPAPPCGVGYLVPKEEQAAVLGVLFHSSAFPDRATDSSRTVLTAMMGGTENASLLQRTDSELIDLVKSEFKKTLEWSGDSLPAVLRRWPHAIPIYGPDLMRAWEALWSDFAQDSGRIAFANWTGQVSLRGMIEFVEALKIEPGRNP